MYSIQNFLDKVQSDCVEGIYFKSKWFSLKWINNKPYKYRVETFILNDRMDSLFLFLDSNNNYKIPGGHLIKGRSKLQQAVNECKEEAGINVCCMKYMGTYLETYSNRKRKSSYLPIKPKGQFVEMFIGKIGSFYNGHIFSHDYDEKIHKYGKFYKIDEIYDILKKEHKYFINLLRK